MSEDTERRILDKLEAIGVDMGRIDLSVAVLASKMPDVGKRLDDHEKRLRGVEARLWAVAGCVTLLAFVTPILVHILLPY